MKWSWNIADTPTCMTEAHDFFSYESPAGNFYDVKNYFRDGLRVNHDETMGYRLSLQPLPNGAAEDSPGQRPGLAAVYR
jgi:hypothetical protein